MRSPFYHSSLTIDSLKFPFLPTYTLMDNKGLVFLRKHYPHLVEILEGLTINFQLVSTSCVAYREVCVEFIENIRESIDSVGGIRNFISLTGLALPNISDESIATRFDDILVFLETEILPILPMKKTLYETTSSVETVVDTDYANFNED